MAVISVLCVNVLNILNDVGLIQNRHFQLFSDTNKKKGNQMKNPTTKSQVWSGFLSRFFLLRSIWSPVSTSSCCAATRAARSFFRGGSWRSTWTPPVLTAGSPAPTACSRSSSASSRWNSLQTLNFLLCWMAADYSPRMEDSFVLWKQT